MPVTIKTARHNANKFRSPIAQAKATHEFFGHDPAYKRSIKLVGSLFDPQNTSTSNETASSTPFQRHIISIII